MIGRLARWLAGRRSAPSRPQPAAAPAAPPDPEPAPLTPAVVAVRSMGRVACDHDVWELYPGAVARWTPCIPMDPKAGSSELLLTVFEAPRVALSTCYVPIDTINGILLINQTYQGLLHFWSPRPKISGDAYSFETVSAGVISRRSVVIGGPIDGNYYHWMLNWFSRLAILKMLRPDIYDDDGVALLLDHRAQQPPFIDMLAGCGLDPSRLVWIYHNQDYLVEDAVLVSFGNQTGTCPEVVEALAALFPPVPAGPGRRRIWISRQTLAPGRRRIHNIAAVREVLLAHGFEEVVLEALAFADQRALFSQAEAVIGVHGAGFANIVFSPPHCQVVTLESDLNFKFGAAYFYSALARACGQPYSYLKVKRAPSPEGVERSLANMHNQDVIVDVQRLDALLRDLLPPAARA